jgi:cytochrome c peroxidase
VRITHSLARRTRAVFLLLVTLLSLATLATLAASTVAARPAPAPWSAADLATIRSLSLASAGSVPLDPSNRYAADPRAAALGRAFFFDQRLSGRGDIACASCHQPGLAFQDGTPLGHGASVTGRRTQPIAGTAYSPWFFWDGRADSQWAQALGPLESAAEHAGTRTLYARVIASAYRSQYEALFGPMPATATLLRLPAAAMPNGTEAQRVAWSRLSDPMRDSVTRVFVNVGKAIAAFERSIEFAPSRFDRYAARLTGASGNFTDADTLTPDERAGLQLFIGKGKCAQCHSGPMFTDYRFHNIGVAGEIDGKPDLGRQTGVDLVLASEFNCLGPYSDAAPAACTALASASRGGDSLAQAFRTPSLRNVIKRPPYGHTGEFATLRAILDHHNRAPQGTAGRSELTPLGLSADELDLIASFLRTLQSREIVGTPMAK